MAALAEQIKTSFRAFAGRESHLFLAILFPNYLASPYCRWEWEDYVRYEAMRQCLGEGVAPVSPARTFDNPPRVPQGFAGTKSVKTVHLPLQLRKTRQAPPAPAHHLVPSNMRNALQIRFRLVLINAKHKREGRYGLEISHPYKHEGLWIRLQSTPAMPFSHYAWHYRIILA